MFYSNLLFGQLRGVGPRFLCTEKYFLCIKFVAPPLLNWPNKRLFLYWPWSPKYVRSLFYYFFELSKFWQWGMVNERIINISDSVTMVPIEESVSLFDLTICYINKVTVTHWRKLMNRVLSSYLQAQLVHDVSAILHIRHRFILKNKFRIQRRFNIHIWFLFKTKFSFKTLSIF